MVGLARLAATPHYCLQQARYNRNRGTSDVYHAQERTVAGVHNSWNDVTDGRIESSSVSDNRRAPFTRGRNCSRRSCLAGLCWKCRVHYHRQQDQP